jgi:hypothetical protein
MGNKNSKKQIHFGVNENGIIDIETKKLLYKRWETDRHDNDEIYFLRQQVSIMKIAIVSKEYIYIYNMRTNVFGSYIIDVFGDTRSNKVTGGNKEVLSYYNYLESKYKYKKIYIPDGIEYTYNKDIERSKIICKDKNINIDLGGNNEQEYKFMENIKYRGNEILINTKDNEYKLIYAEGCYTFNLDENDEIVQFISPIENNGVSYPAAFSKKYVYILWNQEYIDIEEYMEFAKNCNKKYMVNDKWNYEVSVDDIYYNSNINSVKKINCYNKI